MIKMHQRVTFLHLYCVNRGKYNTKKPRQFPGGAQLLLDIGLL